MVETPFQFVQQSMVSCRTFSRIIHNVRHHGQAAGTAVPSMVSNLLGRVKGQDQGGEYVRAVKESSVTAFAGS